MFAEFKRVVTAVDEKGEAVVAEETAVEPVEVAMLPGVGFYPVWGCDSIPKVPVEDPSAVHVPIFPAPAGSRFGIVRFPPASAATEAEIDEARLGALVAECEEKLPGLVGVMEPDGSGMHTTQTVDYDIVCQASSTSSSTTASRLAFRRAHASSRTGPAMPGTTGVTSRPTWPMS